MRSPREIIPFLKQLLADIKTVNNSKATGIIEYEIRQMETIFSLLVFGSFIGMPSPPVHITLQLLPLMEEDALLLFQSVTTAKDALGELTEILGEP